MMKLWYIKVLTIIIPNIMYANIENIACLEASNNMDKSIQKIQKYFNNKQGNKLQKEIENSLINLDIISYECTDEKTIDLAHRTKKFLINLDNELEYIKIRENKGEK